MLILNKLLYEIDRLYGFLLTLFFKKKIEDKLKKILFSLSIETTNVCNANCIFCAYQHQKRGEGIMTIELFKKIIYEYVSVGGGNLGLTPTVGEPLADKFLLERIKFAKQFKEIKKIGIYSNLISLQKFGVENLVNSGLTDFSVSTSGFDKEMYRRVYRSSQYEKMFKNLLELIEINKKFNYPINISVSMRSDRSLSETISFNDYKYLIKFFPESKIDYKFRYDNWAGKINQNDLTGIMKLRNKNHALRISACSEFFSGPHVYWNGEVGICGCRDVDGKELIIGNANLEKIYKIWYNSTHIQLMEDFLISPKKICQNCSHYNNISVFQTKENRITVKGQREIY